MSLIYLALLCFLSCLILHITGQPEFLQEIPTTCYFEENVNNYTDKSAYHFNIITVLSSLDNSATEFDHGFYNMSYGEDPDRVRAIGLCRGDISRDYCRSCLNYTTWFLSEYCPNLKEAMVYNDFCMLRYTDKSILGLYEKPNYFLHWDTSRDVKQAKFNVTVNELLQNLTRKAAAGERKFAASSLEILVKESTSLYGLVQCTPDLSEKDCGNCLQKAILEINDCCGNKNGARVVKLSCYIRYEVYLFYNATALNSLQSSPPPPPSPSSQEGGRAVPKAALIKIIVPSIITLLIPLSLLGCFLRRKRKKTISRKAILRQNFGEESSKLKNLQFSYAIIEAATNRFSEENRIGKGGFGQVYKGILIDGREIAVKRLSRNSTQGTSEFKNEILSIAKLQHKNLVTLLGFCLEEQERILIYEYVPNKSLDFFLFDSGKRRLLNWAEHLNIIRGIAQGLSYMHEHSRLKVIHRDLKPNNILLDGKMNPKISDFGMAKIITIDADQVNTNKIVGTFGYMAPEYIMHGNFSAKSDVFSFGVIILEMLSGKRNARSYESHLLTDVWKQWNNGTPLQALDSFLIESCSCQAEAIKCEQIGLLCVQKNPEERPTLAQIVSYLSNLSIQLPSPREPSFFMNSNINTTRAGSGLHQNNAQSSNEMSETELLPR